MFLKKFYARFFVAVFDEFGKALNQFPFVRISAHLMLFTCSFWFAPTFLTPAMMWFAFFVHDLNIFFGDGDEFFKGRRVVDGKLCHHFSVDGDARFGQAANQFAVRKSAYASGRVDSGNPQAAEFALFDSAVAVRVLAGLHD